MTGLLYSISLHRRKKTSTFCCWSIWKLLNPKLEQHNFLNLLIGLIFLSSCVFSSTGETIKFPSPFYFEKEERNENFASAHFFSFSSVGEKKKLTLPLKLRQDTEITRSPASETQRVTEKERQMERWSSDHRNAEAESVQLFSNTRQAHPEKTTKSS